MKTIDVVAAIIVKDDQILATQRGYGEFEGGWEFPGGKVEPGESPEAAIVREIHEELDAQIAVDDFLVQVEHDYPTFYLSMKCYLCSLESDFQLLEHHAAKWLSRENIDAVDWLPADVKVVDALKERWGK
jgi:8-oxo-dGTP diphosphatase